jgi:hypothetical protein
MRNMLFLLGSMTWALTVSTAFNTLLMLSAALLAQVC